MTSVASPNAYSSAEQCTFDLRFCESENDECLTQSLDLFGRSQPPCDTTPCQELLDAEDDKRTHCKKRKMDKDGFVTPTTPDIPKSSLQYGLPARGYHEQSDGSGERGQMETEDRKEQPPPDGMSFSDNMAHPNIISSEAQVPEKKYDSVAELFEDMAQGTKMLIIQMSQSFRESEEYEAVCLHNVEQMLAKAQALEQDLRHQKELLQQRLFLISQRLNTDH